MIEAGAQSGRWETMVTVSPGPVHWQKELEMHWKRVRYFASFPLVRPLLRTPLRMLLPAGPRRLVELSMIGCARWSLFDRVPTGVPKDQARKLPRPFLLFETNYNGDRDVYFESFSYIVPRMMNRVWDRAYNVPDARWVSAFQQHINDNKSPIDYYYAAYPQGSTKMIRSALELKRMLAAFGPRVRSLDGGQFEREFGALLARAQRIRNPARRAPRKTHSLTTLVPVEPGRNQDARAALACVQDPPLAVPDEETHFARWCVLDQLSADRHVKRDPRSYLLFSAWFDGPASAYVRALYDRLGPARVARIWGLSGYAGAGPEDFAAYLRRHRVESNSVFNGYDGACVDEVRHALSLREAFSGFAASSQSLSGDALRAAWLADPVLGQVT